MDVTVLGCHGPYPAPGGATSGYLVRAGETLLQLDMGSGVLAALTGYAAPEDLTALVLSHWHYDHACDVLPLLYRLESLGRRLCLYAPADAASPIRQAAERSPAVTLRDIAPGDRLTLGEVTLEVAQARHPVPAVMLRLQGDGKTLCYTGDTNTVPHLAAFARQADLLLADGLFTRALWAEDKPHLAAAQAAEVAREAGVKTLVVTHLNPAIDPKTLLKEAREIRPDAILAERGQVYRL